MKIILKIPIEKFQNETCRYSSLSKLLDSIIGILARTLLARCVNILEPLLQSQTSSSQKLWMPMQNILKLSRSAIWAWHKLYAEYSILEDGNALTISIHGFESSISSSNHY